MSKEERFKWYQVRIPNLGERSARFFDSATGLWIICFDLKPRREVELYKTTLCYHWDPDTRHFVRLVKEWFTTTISTFHYCTRRETSRNLRVEAVSTKRTYDYSKRREYDGFRGLWDRFLNDQSETLENVANCLRCFGLGIDTADKFAQLTTTEYIPSVCYYDRCFGLNPKENKMFEFGMCTFNESDHEPVFLEEIDIE